MLSLSTKFARVLLCLLCVAVFTTGAYGSVMGAAMVSGDFDQQLSSESAMDMNHSSHSVEHHHMHGDCCEIFSDHDMSGSCMSDCAAFCASSLLGKAQSLAEAVFALPAIPMISPSAESADGTGLFRPPR